jgi:uncharacterized protein YndB with AHSA1/START domain
MPAIEKNAAESASSQSQPLELTITRTFNAPRELVWKLFTEPQHLMQWMGPRDFEARNFTQNARVGGSWRGMLHPTKGGKDLWQGGTFRAIDPPSHISYTFAWEDDSGTPSNDTVVTLDFEAVGDTTRLTFRQSGFPTKEERDGHRGGWGESFDKLDEYLGTARARSRDD